MTSGPTRPDHDHIDWTTLAAAAAGDPRAAIAVYEATAGSVFATALMVLRSELAAAEVTRTVYERAWRDAPPEPPGSGTVATWLVGHAHRLAVERARGEDDERAAGPGRAADLVPRHQIRDLLDAVTPPGGELLRLTWVDGYTMDQVALLQARERRAVGEDLTAALRGLRQHVGSSSPPTP